MHVVTKKKEIFVVLAGALDKIPADESHYVHAAQAYTVTKS